jgi:hypothetical protein
MANQTDVLARNVHGTNPVWPLRMLRGCFSSWISHF